MPAIISFFIKLHVYVYALDTIVCRDCEANACGLKAMSRRRGNRRRRCTDLLGRLEFAGIMVGKERCKGSFIFV